LTDEQNDATQPEPTVAPPRPGRLRPPPRPRSSDAGIDESGDYERTSPSPYAEKFDEWVADETDSKARENRRRTAR
jgi:hypothetical protein